MHLLISLRILGLLLALFSVTMLPPLGMAIAHSEVTVSAFLYSFLISLGSGLLMWLPLGRLRRDLQTRDGFLITALFWTVLGLFGSLPFALTESLQISAMDSIFESISGLTTTGATVLTGLDSFPSSLLLYRQMLQWMGGIGIIVVAVAVLPMLGIGGMQLYKAEVPGPSKDSKLTPRITETAKALFFVYLTLTVLCAVAYSMAGMSKFDAICHSFSTVAIGGFSTHDASMGYFESNTIYLVSTVFMLAAALNIGLHYTAFHRRSLRGYAADSEARFFASAMIICVSITCGFLVLSKTLSVEDGIVHGLFQAVSITTTTGFATQDFSIWPSFLPVMLIFFSFMGGCVGSTGGGMKVMRMMLIFKQGMRELKQLVHPHAIIPLKVRNRRVEATVISAVWSFFAVYAFAFAIIMLVLMMTGLDFLSAFSAVAASLNNLGPGLGSVAANYGEVSTFAKSVLCFAMLLGRLEVFTLLVLFTPVFWRN
ncbi:MAG: TrkH family potassium uptake protein [Pseudomonadota bacterium]